MNLIKKKKYIKWIYLLNKFKIIFCIFIKKTYKEIYLFYSYYIFSMMRQSSNIILFTKWASLLDIISSNNSHEFAQKKKTTIIWKMKRNMQIGHHTSSNARPVTIHVMGKIVTIIIPPNIYTHTNNDVIPRLHAHTSLPNVNS
jgi:hypothetical protein